VYEAWGANALKSDLRKEVIQEYVAYVVDRLGVTRTAEMAKVGAKPE
jgi:hypothetical protein